MLSKNHKKWLEGFVKRELGENFDLFDLEANIDNELTYEENKEQIKEKLHLFREDMKEQIGELQKEEKYNQMSQNFTQSNYDVDLVSLFQKPAKIGIIGDANTGKTNLVHHVLNELSGFEFNLYTYGLKIDYGEIKINSLEELERIRDSVIILDEFFNLFELDDRKKRKAIEKTFRLIFHNNNILVLIGLPDNYKKYISNLMDYLIFCRVTLGSFINGSRAKQICLNYCGVELGSNLLNMDKGECLLYDGNHYKKLKIPYYKDKDTKRKNSPIICAKNVHKKGKNSVENVEQKRDGKNIEGY